MLVSSKNMYIDIKPNFYLLVWVDIEISGHEIISWGDTFQTPLRGLVVSQEVNKYGSSVFAVSKSYRK